MVVLTAVFSFTACGDDDVVARDPSRDGSTSTPDARPPDREDLGPPDASIDARVPPDLEDASVDDASVPEDASAPDGITTPDDAGDPSDATAPDADVRPGYSDLVVRGVGFDRYDGLTLFAVYEDTSVGRISERLSTTVVDGRWELLWPLGFNRDLFGVILYVMADTDGDGACGSADEVSQFFVSNDFTMGPLIVEYMPGDGTDDTCARFP